MIDNSFLLQQNTALNELQFELIASICKNDIDCIYKKMMLSGIDDVTLGFWIWDLENDLEIYSPSFRSSLQFVGEKDFPNVPESWKKQIQPKSLELALETFYKHANSKGEIPYIQKVTYNRKIKGKVDLICHGKIISWINNEPKLMIGVHMKTDGRYIKK